MEDRDLYSLSEVELEERFDEAFGDLYDAIVQAGEDAADHIDPHWQVCEEDIEEMEFATWRLNPPPY